MSNPRTIATTIRVSPEIWCALRQLAERRALADGGRPSASAVVAELIERAADQELAERA